MPKILGRDDAELIKKIEQNAQWVHLPKGERLIREGDPSDSFYLLLSGRLYATSRDDGGGETVVNEIRRGETVGELGLFTQEPRTASVYAARSSDLAKFSADFFQEAVRRHSSVLPAFMRMILQRVRTRQDYRANRRYINVAVLPAAPGVPVAEFTRRLASALSGRGATEHLTSKRIDRALDAPGISQVAPDNPKSIRLSAWLDQLESHNAFVLYEVDPDLSAWTRRCVEQADAVLLVARAGDSTGVCQAQSELERGIGEITRPFCMLVVIHPDGGKLPTGTCRWREGRVIDDHEHVRWNSNQDFERIARRLGGRSMGLVLGGGGARGLAHIGVLRALSENGIPVDAVGGTSSGAMIAGLTAMGMDWREMRDGFHEGVIRQRPLKDYTVPMISLLYSRKFDAGLRKAFGETRIEDLWIPYFCISSNLSRAGMEVHGEGVLWEAIRASISLPGIVPPVVSRKHFLVDGGVVNNLPTDVMRNKCGGSIILVNVSDGLEMEMADNRDCLPTNAQVFWSRMNPFASRVSVPGILSIIMRTTLLSSIQRANETIRDADFVFTPDLPGVGLLDFDRMDDIIEMGYDCACRQLEQDGANLRAMAGAAPRGA